MTIYVKGYKIDRQKIANMLEARDEEDPLVDAGIRVIVERLNRSAYKVGSIQIGHVYVSRNHLFFPSFGHLNKTLFDHFGS